MCRYWLRRFSRQLENALPAQRVRHASDGILYLAANLLSLAVYLQLGIAEKLADDLLCGADHLLAGTDNSILVLLYQATK